MVSAKFSEFLTSSNCLHLDLIYTTEFTQPSSLRPLFNDPLPPWCGHHIWRPPSQSSLQFDTKGHWLATRLRTWCSSSGCCCGVRRRRRPRSRPPPSPCGSSCDDEHNVAGFINISVLRSHSLHLQHWARPIQLNHKLCNQISDYKKVRIKQEGNTLIDLHGFFKKIYYIIPILSRSGITYKYLINGHFPKIITRYQGAPV